MAQEIKYQRRDSGIDRSGAAAKRETDGDFEVDRNNLPKRRRETGDIDRPSGTYRGRGPKNYRRRDERILEDVNDLMCDNAYLDASEIEVTVSEGNVVLSGTVENRESKRLAEDIAESVSGVQNVENTLRVRKKGI